MEEKDLVRGTALYDALIEKLSTAPDAYNQLIVGEPSSKAPCGTEACLGGWGMILSGLASQITVTESGSSVSSDVEAAWNKLPELLGIGRYVANNHLFTRFASNWPEPFGSDYQAAVTNEQRAQVAIALLTELRDLPDQESRNAFLLEGEF